MSFRLFPKIVLSVLKHFLCNFLLVLLYQCRNQTTNEHGDQRMKSSGNKKIRSFFKNNFFNDTLLSVPNTVCTFPGVHCIDYDLRRTMCIVFCISHLSYTVKFEK